MRFYYAITLIIMVFYSGCGNKPEPVKVIYNRPQTLAAYDTIKREIYREPIGPETNVLKYYGRIEEGETLSVALLRTGIDYKIAEQIILNLKGVLDFRRCKADDSFIISLSKDNSELLSFEYSSSPIENYIIERDEEGRFVSYKEEYEVEKRIEFVTGRIQGSLYETMEKVGEDPQLSVILANEVFAWDIDFYTEVMPDDEFKIIVEKYYSGSYFIQYGRILAAMYTGKATGKKEA
ncbi:MAG: hypothetical protein N3B13_08380, partial [Deltaproteobacteria bacterium]|nr:hypothetical protein [Deltaproteobacteria bacterium]